MIKILVERHIAENFITIFSKSSCPFCIKAKQTFTDLNQRFSALELDTRDDGQDIQSYLLKKTGQSTVPNIFIGRNHLGGYNNLLAAKANGTLIKLLETQ